MRVRVDSGWGGPREMSLEQALTPSAWDSSGGSLEAARDAANAANECIGRLAALLVEKRVLTLEEARIATGCFYKMEEV
jgi:hypothetical protein